MKTLRITNTNFFYFKNRLVIKLWSKSNGDTRFFIRHHKDDYISMAFIFRGYGVRIIIDIV